MFEYYTFLNILYSLEMFLKLTFEYNVERKINSIFTTFARMAGGCVSGQVVIRGVKA